MIIVSTMRLLLSTKPVCVRIIVVDSTRRGKRFPDALSKTIPIWCAVINRAIFRRPDGRLPWSEEDLDIHTATMSVGESERDQIRSRLDGWATDLLVRHVIYSLAVYQLSLQYYLPDFLVYFARFGETTSTASHFTFLPIARRPSTPRSISTLFSRDLSLS